MWPSLVLEHRFCSIVQLDVAREHDPISSVRYPTEDPDLTARHEHLSRDARALERERVAIGLESPHLLFTVVADAPDVEEWMRIAPSNLDELALEL